jgi:hypothetical protein
MATIHVERICGLAGFGGSRANLRSRGQLEHSKLSTGDQKAVDALFESPAKSKSGSRAAKDSPETTADGLRYRISRTTAAGTETIEVPESAIPAAIARCVKDELV